MLDKCTALVGIIEYKSSTISDSWVKLIFKLSNFTTLSTVFYLIVNIKNKKKNTSLTTYSRKKYKTASVYLDFIL